MKNIIVLLVGLLFFSSCGVHMKNLHKDKEIDKTETKKVDSASSKLVDTSSSKLIDTSKTTITRKVDTVIHIPGISIGITLNANDSTGSDSVIERVVKKNGLKIKTTYNKKTKEIKTDAEKDDEDHHVFVDEKIEQKNGVTVENKAGVTQESKSSSSFIEKKNIVTKKKEVSKKHNYSANTIMFGIVILVALVIVLYWFFGKPKKSKTTE